MSEDPFIVKQPREWFDKPIDFAIKEPLKAVVSAAGNAAGGNLLGAMTELGKGLIDLFNGVKTDTPGEACYAMVLQAYQEALKEFFTTHRPERMQAKKVQEKNLNKWVEELKEVLVGKEYDVRDALLKPRSFEMVKDLGDLLGKWLEKTRLNKREVQGVIYRIEGLYIKKFLELSLNENETFQPFLELANQINSPFFKANLIEREWERYREELRQLPDEPIFAEAFGLRPIYVPLRAKLKIDEKELDGKKFKLSKYLWEWKDLESYLTAWVLGEKPGLPNVQFISGGPGSGKSSFCKMWAAYLAEKYPEIYPIFVPLHRYRIEENLDKGIREFLNQNNFFNQVEFKLNGNKKRIVLILDGLDELALSQREITHTLLGFIESLLRLAENWQHVGNPISILISGREFAVQENEPFFNGYAGWLKLLPFKKENNDQTMFKNTEKLINQRDEWWKNFQELRGKKPTGIPDQIESNEKLENLSIEPLLNYLLAVSIEKGLQIKSQTRNKDIYESLVSSVYKRDYHGKRYTLPGIKPFEETQFFQALEEIAVACWHQKTRSATMEQIERQFEKQNKKILLEDYMESWKAGSAVKSLVVAFFFYASKSSEGEWVFEFIHKSFMEYFIARKIVKSAVLIDEKMKKTGNNKNLEIELTRDKALAQWFELTGPTVLNREMIYFIFEETEALNLKKAKALQKRFATFIEDACQENLPLVIPERSNMQWNYFANRFRNGTTAFFAIATGTTLVTMDLTMINCQNPNLIGTFIRKICPQRTSNEYIPLLSCLASLYLPKQNLAMANLNQAILIRSNLKEANLEKIHLEEANLALANLQGANLEKANLQGANLEKANLQGANLEKANLQGANLEKANLRGANLKQARLEDVSLRGADLYKVNLNGANLKGANLQRANLVCANLSEADLKGAKLKWANLFQSNLEKSNLENADFSWARLVSANLLNSNLKGINLTEADLDWSHVNWSQIEIGMIKKIRPMRL